MRAFVPIAARGLFSVGSAEFRVSETLRLFYFSQTKNRRVSIAQSLRYLVPHFQAARICTRERVSF